MKPPHTKLGNCIKLPLFERVVNIWLNEVWKGCVNKDTATSFFLVCVQGNLYTEHSIDNMKYHGNPFNGWQRLVWNRY